MESVINTILLIIGVVISVAFLAFAFLLFKDALKKREEPKKKVLFTRDSVFKTPLPEYESTY